MKFRLLVKLGEWILGQGMSEEEPRADMYLPIWLLAFGMALVIGGIAFGIYAAVALQLAVGLVALGAAALGTAAILCWKNQTIVMLPNDSFEYTTFLGNRKTYRFRDIRGLKAGSDSLTLLVGQGKVHIESIAILSPRLRERIGRALEE